MIRSANDLKFYYHSYEALGYDEDNALHHIGAQNSAAAGSDDDDDRFFVPLEFDNC